MTHSLPTLCSLIKQYLIYSLRTDLTRPVLLGINFQMQ
nr:MAG TPA: hypothetical protein [Caudoviricetes sp.]DAU41379.1 MAG TPA: hypothetical protein [Bacteriophage sp.]